MCWCVSKVCSPAKSGCSFQHRCVPTLVLWARDSAGSAGGSVRSVRQHLHPEVGISRSSKSCAVCCSAGAGQCEARAASRSSPWPDHLSGSAKEAVRSKWRALGGQSAHRHTRAGSHTKVLHVCSRWWHARSIVSRVRIAPDDRSRNRLSSEIANTRRSVWSCRS